MTELYHHSHVNSPSFARDLAYVRFRTVNTRGARIGGISLPARANLPFYALLTQAFSRRLNLWKRQAGQPEYRQEGFPPGVYWGRPCVHHSAIRPRPLWKSGDITSPKGTPLSLRSNSLLLQGFYGRTKQRRTSRTSPANRSAWRNAGSPVSTSRQRQSLQQSS